MLLTETREDSFGRKRLRSLICYGLRSKWEKDVLQDMSSSLELIDKQDPVDWGYSHVLVETTLIKRR